MSRTPAMTGTNTMSFPRVSGDEPLSGASIPHLNRFSPRERG